jgi:putative transposase
VSRIARIVIPEWPYHVTHRGNNKQPIFYDEEDIERYIRLVRVYKSKWNCKILGYSLMPNHIHLLIVPSENPGLAKAMQGISLCYAQDFNRRYKRTGRLWEARYFSSIIDRDHYFWAVVRYIDWNSVRAGLVKKPEVYKWSSAKVHMLGIEDPLVNPLDLEEYGEQSQYDEYLENQGSEKEIRIIKSMTKKGLPIGSIEFQRFIEAKTERKLIRKMGRPSKIRT